MDTTTEIKHIDHLGLVATVCDEAGIVGLINEYVGKDGRKVSVGHAYDVALLAHASVFFQSNFPNRGIQATTNSDRHSSPQVTWQRCAIL